MLLKLLTEYQEINGFVYYLKQKIGISITTESKINITLTSTPVTKFKKMLFTKDDTIYFIRWFLTQDK